MDWDQVREIYLCKMEDASGLADRLFSLCQKNPFGIESRDFQEIEKLRTLVKRQTEKLRNNRFEVAVLGLEKAGKSTLLNAWLGTEILPAMDERCTYTACEIMSAESESDQKFQIQFFSKEEFEKQNFVKHDLLKSPNLGASERSDLQKDLDEIEGLRTEIYNYIDGPDETKKFQDVDDVRDDLKNAIATNKAKARSIRKIKLQTINLRRGRDIVFYDVPGFNSPMQLHKDLANKKLQTCDAILYAKEHDKPDLVDSEIRMLDVGDAEDPHIKVSGKIFIALTRIDKSESEEILRRRIENAYSKWKNVPKERVIPVCPPAHLFQNGNCSHDLMLSGPKILKDLKLLGFGDGIDELKNSVGRYIDTDRSRVVRMRCDALLDNLKEITHNVLEKVQAEYPTNLKDFNLLEEEKAYNQFEDWWKIEWKQINEGFNLFFRSNIMGKENFSENIEEHEKLIEFKNSFNQFIDSFFEDSKIFYRDKRFEERYHVLGGSQEGVIHAQTAHSRLREEIHRNSLHTLNDISAGLAGTLEGMMEEIGDWIFDRMWKIERIKDDLFDSTPSLHERLEHGISTLFLRFSRPAFNLFLNFPRGQRQQYLETYKPEIRAFEEFYQAPDGDIISKIDLGLFLKTGKWVLDIAANKPEVQLMKKSIDYLEVFANSNGTSYQQTADSFEDIKKEIEEDIKGLQDQLKNSIFYAAGFYSYCRQELDRIRLKFIKNESEWKKIVHSAFRRKHPQLTDIQGLKFEDIEFRRSIVAELSQVRAAYQKIF